MRWLSRSGGGFERQPDQGLDEITLVRDHRFGVPCEDAGVALRTGPEFRRHRLICINRDFTMAIRARFNDLITTAGTPKVVYSKLLGAARAF